MEFILLIILIAVIANNGRRDREIKELRAKVNGDKRDPSDDVVWPVLHRAMRKKVDRAVAERDPAYRYIQD